MNASNLIAGAIQVSSGKFSDYWDFMKYIFKKFGYMPYDKTLVFQKLTEVENQEKPFKGLITNEKALHLLMQKDIQQCKKVIISLPTEDELRENLVLSFNSSVEILKSLGLIIPLQHLNIVKKFPEPYCDMDWIAFSPDKADERDFGIKPGVYLLESELSPYFSSLTIAHELIHSVIGIPNPNLLGRGLEEGIAEIFGTLLLGSRLYSKNIVKNIFIHTRLGSNNSQSSSLYFDYTRQAAKIYYKFGMTGLLELIKGGRDKIKEVEDYCLQGKFSSIDLPSGQWDDKLTSILDEVLFGFIPNLVLSPLALYISQFIEVGQTISEIAKIACVKEEDATTAIGEIQEMTFTILVDKEVVIYSDLNFLRNSGSLRYRINS